MSDPEIFLEPQAEPAAEVSEQPVNIQEYLRLVLDRWRLILSLTLVCVGAAIAHYFMTPKLYRARTTIQIEQRNISPVGSANNPWLDAWWSMKYYPTQYRLLRSRGLAERVVVNLRLMDDARFNPARAVLPAADDAAPVTADADENMVARLANRLLTGLSIEPVRDTELVDLFYVSHYPDLAARIVNAHVEEYIDWGIETRSQTVDKASSFLEGQIETLKREIDDKERELQQYGRQSDIMNLDPGSNLTLQRLDRLNQDLAAALGDRLEKEARYNQLLAAPRETVADRETGGLVSKLAEEQIKLEREYETKLKRYKEDWPEMVQLRAKIEEGAKNLGRVIDDNLRKARQSANAEYQTALRRERSLEQEIQKVKSEAMDLGVAAIEFKNLEMVIANRRDLLENLLDRLSEAGVSAQLQTTRESNIRQVDKALVPTSSFRPSLTNNLSAGLGGGLLLGVGLVFLFHYLDRTIKGAEELERLLSLPVLAVIPDVSEGGRGYSYYRSYGYGASGRKNKKGPRRAVRRKTKAQKDEEEKDYAIELLPERRPQLAVSEAYRSLRTALLLSTAQELKSVGVTSADAGEGKTTTATNLAVVMAQLGRRVLLLDADLRKARLHQIFDVSNRVGLVNYLTGGVELEEILRPTAVANLTVCPSGPHPPNPSELLASDRMRETLAQLRSRFDFVIVDTPPVLVVTDAILTGSICDGLVLCFRAKKVLREDAVTCRNRLRLAGVKLLGTVLNRYRPGRSGYYDRRYQYYEAYTTPPKGKAADSAA